MYKATVPFCHFLNGIIDRLQVWRMAVQFGILGLGGGWPCVWRNGTKWSCPGKP